MSAKERRLYLTPGEVRPQEVAFVREQAEFWKALGGVPFHRLAPACNRCGADEDQLAHLPATCEWVCQRCGDKSGSIEVHAGRIVAR